MPLFRLARLFANSQPIEDRIELATDTVITDRLKEYPQNGQQQRQ